MRRFALIGLLAFVGATAALSAAPEPFTAGERHLATTSPTAAERNRGEAALRITIWYPASASEAEVDIGPPKSPLFVAGRAAKDAAFADARRHPLVLLSHGFGGSARQMTWLGTALARHGSIALAVDHPGANSVDGITDAGAYAPWERAADLRAALDFALARPELARHIDSRRIGVAGFALGGYAALLAIGARSDFRRFAAFCESRHRDAMCDRQREYPLDYRRLREILSRPGMQKIAADESSRPADSRIRAAFLIAPAFVEALDPTSLARIRVPIAVLLGSADQIAPPATNGARAARLIPGARLRILPGVGHYDFLSECGPAGFVSVAPLCVDGRGTKRARTHRIAAAAAVAFFDSRLGRR